MNTRVIPAIGLNLARRCKSVLLAQLYYAERELLLCCGVLTAFLGFFGAEGVFDSLPLELFADTSLRLRSFETTSCFLAPEPHDSRFFFRMLLEGAAARAFYYYFVAR